MKRYLIILALFIYAIGFGQEKLMYLNKDGLIYRNKNGLIYATFTPQYKLALKYKERVEADGGEIIDFNYIVSKYRMLVNNNDLDSIQFLLSAAAGVRTQINGADTLVNKLYDLSKKENNHVQATISEMPKLRRNTNGIYPSLELDGVDDYMLAEKLTFGFEQLSYYATINVPFPSKGNSGVGGRNYLSGGKGFGFNLVDATNPDTILASWQVRDGVSTIFPTGVYEPDLDKWRKWTGLRDVDTISLYINEVLLDKDVVSLGTIDNNTQYHAIGSNSTGAFELEGNVFEYALYNYAKEDGIEDFNDGNIRINLGLNNITLADTQLGYEYEYYGTWDPSTEIWPTATYANYPRNLWKITQDYNWDGIQFNEDNYIMQTSDTFNIKDAGSLLSEVVTDTSRLFFEADSLYWVHPDCEELTTPWYGYKFWFAITGILEGEEEFENPHIFKSNSPDEFEKILANPIYLPPTYGAFNSDVDIFLHDDTMNVVSKSNYEETGTESVKYYLIRSGDTVNWDTVKIMSWDQAVFNPVSPSFVDSSGIWIIYAINSDGSSVFNPVRFTNTELTTGWQTSPGSNTGESINFIDYPNDRPWHIDVQIYNNKYYCLVNDFDGSLWWGWSMNGIDFNFQQFPVSKESDYYRSSFSFTTINGKDYIRFWVNSLSINYSVQYELVEF
jgi:hypothetical protein